MIRSYLAAEIVLAIVIGLVSFEPSVSLALESNDKVAISDLNLRELGVICDGNADDSSSINAAINSFREQFKSKFEAVGRIRFPQGNCNITKSINLTGFKSKSLTLDGAGSRIIGTTKGKPVIDAMGTEYLRIRDLTIVGSSHDSPNIGLQIGRSGDTDIDSADNINIDSVAITGTFDFAALYNLNSETTIFNHLIAVNESSRNTSYVVVQDGMNHFNAHSDFIEVTQRVDKPQSFNENIFVNCDIRHNGFGVPIWISHSARHAFVRSYIAAIHGQLGVILYSKASNDLSSQLSMDAHFETNSLDYIFRFSGPNRDPIFKGLTYIDHHPDAQKSLFSAPEARQLEVQDLILKIPSMPKNTMVFEDAKKWTISGSIYMGESGGNWNLPKGNFQGILNINGKVTFLSAN